jgi:hypothetical protein
MMPAMDDLPAPGHRPLPGEPLMIAAAQGAATE